MLKVKLFIYIRHIICTGIIMMIKDFIFIVIIIIDTLSSLGTTIIMCIIKTRTRCTCKIN